MKTYILTTNVREKIDLRNYDDIVIIADQDISLSNLAIDNLDKNAVLPSGNTLSMSGAKYIWVKGLPGAVISIFDNAYAGGGGSGGGTSSCSFDGIYISPEGQHITGLSPCDFVQAHFQSINPTVDIRGTTYPFGIYEVGETLTTPLIEGRGHLGGNPAGTLTSLDIAPLGFTQTNPANNTWYGTNDANITITLGATVTYTATISDDQGRSANANGSYTGTFPYYGTSANITTLTKQGLLAIGSTYFPVDMVAETGGDKYKADFETANISITGVMFYNTVSGNWEWMGGSKANSLTLRTTSTVTHTVQGNVVNYTRYIHNGVDGAALQTRFYTN